jgi:hypothetical protein
MNSDYATTEKGGTQHQLTVKCGSSGFRCASFRSVRQLPDLQEIAFRERITIIRRRNK